MKTNLAFLMVGLFSATTLWGAEAETPLIVLRFSEQALNRSLSEPIERRSAVDSVILETHVVGQALTKGQPCIKLVEDVSGASFQVQFRGTTVARTTGTHAPVIIHSRSETDFVAEKTLSLEQRGGVCRHPTKIEAQTRTTTEDITTDRRFPVRRLVLRKAWQAVTARQAEANAIAKRDAEARIAEAFDSAIEAKLSRLDQQIALRGFVALMLPNSSPAYRYATKDGFLSVAVYAHQPEGKGSEVALPAFPGTAEPMQVWLHRSLVGDQFDTALTNIDALRNLLNIPTTLVAAITDQRLPAKNWTVVDDWYVVQLKGAALTR